MSESVYVQFSIPANAEKIPAVNQLLKVLEPYDLDDVTYYKKGMPPVKTFQFSDSSSHMSGWEQSIQSLVHAKVPFDMQTEAYSESPETHYIFREGMKEPYEYYGEEPSVSVETLRDILKNDPDYTREHLIEYLDAHHPELPPLEKAAKDWEKKHSSQLNR